MSQQVPNQSQPVAVGIDLGSFQSVIAVFKRGMPEVITNEANFRETPNIVGFAQSERYLGETGQVKLKANYKDTVTYITRFLGLPYDSSLLAEEKKFINVQTETSKGGRFAFRVNYQDESQIFLPQEIVGAFMSKLKSILSLNKINKDEPVVLSVPSYFNVFERKSILDAAAIADLKVTRLMNDSSAIALDYYMSHKEELMEKEPRNILLVDFGHSKLSLTVVSFIKGRIVVLAQHHERNLGCRNIDQLMLQFYRQHMIRTAGVDLYESKKAVVKLIENIEKQRKVLSANSDHSLNMEYLIDDHDLTYTMKREQFQKIAENVFSRCFQALQKIMHVTNNEGIKLHGIELIGGGTRIPAMIKLVQNIFKIEPARTVNSSESIAKGCAYMAVNKSPNFRSLDLAIEQQNYNSISALWKYGNLRPQPCNLSQIMATQFQLGQSSVLFPVGCSIPSTKELKIERGDAVDVLLCYDPQILGFHKNLALCQVDKLQAAVPTQLLLKITMDENGFVSFDSCEVVSREQPSLKATMRVIPYVNLTTDNLRQLAGGEQRMLEQDKSTQKTYELKNKLEAHVYATKEKLKTTYKDYIGPGQLEPLENKLEELTNWIYNADLKTTHHDLLAKKEDIDKVLEPILAKIKSHEELVKVVKEAKDEITKCTKRIQSNEKKYMHIPIRQRQSAMLQVDKLDKFIDNAVHLQSKAPKWKPLLTTLDEIKEKVQTMKQAVEAVMNSPQEQSNIRRSQFVEPTYNKQQRPNKQRNMNQSQQFEEELKDQPQYEQQCEQPQYRHQYQQPQQPYNPFGYQDPFFGGYRNTGYPTQPRPRPSQNFKPQQSRYQPEQPQYYQQQQRPRQRNQNSMGFNPFGSFFGGW